MLSAKNIPTPEFAEIKKSFMYDYILVKINSESSLIEDSN